MGEIAHSVSINGPRRSQCHLRGTDMESVVCDSQQGQTCWHYHRSAVVCKWCSSTSTRKHLQLSKWPKYSSSSRHSTDVLQRQCITSDVARS